MEFGVKVSPKKSDLQAWKRHGSKLNAVAAKLREIRAEALAQGLGVRVPGLGFRV